MKNKLVTYGLIVVVLGLWGTIVYKLVNSTNKEKEEYAVVEDLFVPVKIKMDTFSLIGSSYPDPFLKGLKTTKRNHNSSVKKKSQPSKAKPKISPEPKKIVTWPSIQFQGLMQTTSNKKTGMLNIAGSHYVVKVGRTYNQIKILYLSEDSIQVNYQDETKAIYP